MKYTIQQIAEYSGANVEALGVAVNGDAVVKWILTDSRIQEVELKEALFVAIKGMHNDGHIYIPELFAKGCRNFLVEQTNFIPKNILEQSTFLVCKNSLQALQALATAHRKQFLMPVLGIIGSNGKTVVKEWLWQLLRYDFNICRSPRSYNSQLGVPLSVLGLEKEHSLALFEAGISKPREMHALQQIIQPDLVILTHFGPAHDAGFISREQKISEKLELAEKADVLVFCKDDTTVEHAVKQFQEGHFTKVISWSIHGSATVQASVTKNKQGGRIDCIYKSGSFSLQIPFSDDASVSNALTCVCVLLALERLDPEHLHRFSSLQPVEMRMQMKQGINGCMLINDSYSSDLHSLDVALSFMERQNPRLGKTIILSDLAETGLPADKLYSKVGDSLRQYGIQKLMAVGSEISTNRSELRFEGQASFYETTSDLFKSIDTSELQDESILLKGARSFHFEDIYKLLVHKAHQTTVQINLDAIIHNLNTYRSLLKPGTKTMVMVKAFSYGSGSHELAKLLQHHRADYLAVAYTDEGVELRKAGITIPILVMNPEAESLRLLLDFGLEPEIYSFDMLEGLLKATEPKRKTNVHIEFDTGMHRLGFMPDEVDQLLAKLLQHPHIQVASVFSHLVASDEDSQDEFTQQQIQQFEKICSNFCPAFNYTILRHLANSSGISRFPQAHFDMVRLGLGLHGVDVSGKLDLQPVSKFRSMISQIKQVLKGDSIGYSRRTTADKDMSIGIVALGYADGLNRLMSNRNGQVYILGKPFDIVGNVCMDMCMVDLTNCEATVGDEVIVFENAATLNALAKACQTIPYEILTCISQRVSREYFQE
ncbi:MAG: bifunctional UDP-N-acetylmuramoyl-tripeptide:D-alanyl-D-alanine ligase/alanine racemase [Flavobacteriaceae bacterium]|nr:bifunctional UDP-N-acetylmuramoyl-tripeptide:D-alanyl-D-alanine ligase/alanine racemase [Flavobacteriaceae bacterium]